VAVLVSASIVHRVSSSLLGPLDPSFRALSGRLKFTVRRHKFNNDSLSDLDDVVGEVLMLSDRLRDHTLVGPLWEGYHESRRCSRDTYPESYITKYSSMRRQNVYSRCRKTFYLQVHAAGTFPQALERCIPHGGVRPFHQKSTFLTQLTLGSYVVQIWSRTPRISAGSKPTNTTEWWSHHRYDRYDCHITDMTGGGLVFEAHRLVYHST